MTPTLTPDYFHENGSLSMSRIYESLDIDRRPSGLFDTARHFCSKSAEYAKKNWFFQRCIRVVKKTSYCFQEASPVAAGVSVAILSMPVNILIAKLTINNIQEYPFSKFEETFGKWGAGFYITVGAPLLEEINFRYVLQSLALNILPMIPFESCKSMREACHTIVVLNIFPMIPFESCKSILRAIQEEGSLIQGEKKSFLGKIIRSAITAIAFSYMHYSPESSGSEWEYSKAQMISALFCGIGLGMLQESKGIMAPVAAHIAHNTLAYTHIRYCFGL